MYVARLILDFIASVAWPVIVAIALWRLWPALTNLVPRVSRVEAAGGAVEFDKFEAESLLRRAVDDPPPDEVVTAGEGPAEELPRRDDAVTPDPSSPQGVSVSMTRGDLEGLARSFARTGWSMGRSGEFSSTPEPAIEWSPEGIPSITSWEGDRAGTSPDRDVAAYMRAAERSGADRRARAREIEQQIVNLKAEAPSGSLASLARGGGAYAKIDVLRSALKRVDPDSPFLRD